MKTIALCAALCLLPAPFGARAQWQENGVPVATVTGDERHCEIISDGAGGSIIVWQTYYSYRDSSDVYAQRLDGDGYPLWTAGGVPVCTAADGQYKPQIVPDGAGGAIIAWTDFRTGDPDIYAQRIDPGGNPLWAVDGIAVCTVTDTYGWHMKSRISLVEAPGGAILVWFDNRSGDYDIYAQRVDTSGTLFWTIDGVAVCTETGDQAFYVRAVPDEAGGALAAWIDERSGEEDIYAQRIAADGTLLWTPGGVPVCTAPDRQRDHEVVADGEGGMICVWESGIEEDTDLYSQRIDADGQPVWTIDGIPVCTEPNAQLWPKLAPDGLGGAFYSWSDRRDAIWYEHAIYVQYISSSGDSLWTAGGILLRSPAMWDNWMTEIAPDGFGGAVVTWFTYAPLPLASPPFLPAFVGEDIQSIYAQRIAADGTVWWQEGGVTLCHFPGLADPIDQKMIPDGGGGAFVTWYNNYNLKGVYAQHVNGIGNAPPTDTGEHPPVPFFARNYPNPFNPATTIVFGLPVDAFVELSVYDASGRRIRRLLDETMNAGRHEAVWNGADDGGSTVASGVYLYRLEAGDLVLRGKMVLLR